MATLTANGSIATTVHGAAVDGAVLLNDTLFDPAVR
jgi:hypothetical protein